MADREKLIEFLLCATSSEVIFGKRKGTRFVKAWRIADHLIANGVTVRERGRWVSGQNIVPSLRGLRWTVRCNLCGCPQDFEHNFCPNCGADMRGDKK